MTYEYECTRCVKVFEVVKRLKNFTTTEKCPECGCSAKKIISSHQSSHGWEPYFDKIQGREFRTKGQFEKYCREKNLFRPTASQIRAHREEYEHKG